MASFSEIVQDVYDRGLSVDRFNELNHRMIYDSSYGITEFDRLFRQALMYGREGEPVNMEKPKPNKVQKVYCIQCKELLMKIYPWGGEIRMPAEGVRCRKCAYKNYQKDQARLKSAGYPSLAAMYR